MKHARADYSHIQDSTGKIGENEPVFLLRGKDKQAPGVIEYWAYQVQPFDEDLANSIMQFAEDMRQWQRENGCKNPDTPQILLYGGVKE